MTGGEFVDRQDAGRRLAATLAEMLDDDVVVLGLPRGGVPVASEVAEALGAPLDVIVVRKLGVPFQPELAMGAIAEDGVRLLDDALIAHLGITAAEIENVERAERITLDERVALYRLEFPPVDLSGRIALIVDDGIATGASAAAACLVARGRGARSVVMAAPVGAPDAASRVPGADRVVCLIRPPGFAAVGAHYRVFDQTSESEVLRHLRRARRGGSAPRVP